MENNNDKKLYTLLVYSENIAGILNQITAVFTRRQVNIESLNVSASSIKNIHKYTITVWSDAEQIEKIQNQQINVAAIEKIEAKPIPFSTKIAVEREDFERLSTLAKKFVAAEKKESKLQKALDAANRLIAKLKTEIAGLKQELSEYKSKTQSFAEKFDAMRT